jgi:hypothetical protein
MRRKRRWKKREGIRGGGRERRAPLHRPRIKRGPQSNGVRLRI